MGQRPAREAQLLVPKFSYNVVFAFLIGAFSYNVVFAFQTGAEHRTRFVCLGETPLPRARSQLALLLTTYLLTF